MQACIAVGIGGFVGSVCRYLLSLAPFSQRGGFPVATLLVNVLGAFVIGLLAGLSTRLPDLHPNWMAFLRAGVCGGFTTFSTFALETHSLLGSGRPWMGVTYMALSLGLGLAAVAGGNALAR